MIQCSQQGCGWVAIAPSKQSARRQYEDHILSEHVTTVEAEVPDGHVQVRTDDGEWKTITKEQAREFYD